MPRGEHPFTTETSEVANKRRQELLSPEQRSEIARKAAMNRWYSPNGQDMERVDSHLRRLGLISQMAWEMGDLKLMVGTITAMGRFEAMKIMLGRASGSGNGPAMEMVKEAEKISQELGAKDDSKDNG